MLSHNFVAAGFGILVVISEGMTEDNMSVFEPVRGAIQSVHVVHTAWQNIAIVEERLGYRSFLMWYEWGKEWELVHGFEMGYLSVYRDELPIVNGELMDVGSSIWNVEDVVLAV